jgi:hypothetical protein
MKELIDRAIELDGGNLFRKILREEIIKIGDAYRCEDSVFRNHLGASIIGNECARSIWYDFHWCKKPSFSGRMQRLFNRGHLEEARFISMLKIIGAQVYSTDISGKQLRIEDHNRHFGGSCDAICEYEGEKYLCEFKTHNDKSFKELEKKGVKEAKFQHYVQMQIYCHKFLIDKCIYMAVNKNTDELYIEIVEYEKEIAEMQLDRAKKIIDCVNVPERLIDDPLFFKCRFCNNKEICHGEEKAEFNCRTCRYSFPWLLGKWNCSKKDKELENFEPCKRHEYRV